MWSKLVHKTSTTYHGWGKVGAYLKPQVLFFLKNIQDGNLRIICDIIKRGSNTAKKTRKNPGLKAASVDEYPIEPWHSNQNYISFKLVGQEHGESEFMLCETKIPFLQPG